MDTAPIRTAVVGLRQGLENVEVVLDHPRFELSAVCDRNRTSYEWMVGERRIEDEADEDAYLSGQTKHCPVIRERPEVRGLPYYDDFDHLLSDDGVDAVMLYVPDPLHAEMTVKALEAGKAVLLTKPLAAAVADGMAILEAARAHPGRFMLGFQFCYSAFARAVLGEIEGGRIGRVRHIYFDSHRAPLHPPHNRKNVAIDGPVIKEQCHWLDLLYLFAGSPRFTSVAAMGGLDVHLATQDIDDNGLVLVQYDNGVRAFLGYTYFRWRGGERFAVIGDAGTMRGSFHELFVENDHGHSTLSLPDMHGHAGYREMHDAFAAMVLDGVPPHSDGPAALENLLISNAAQLAVIEQRFVARAEVEPG